MDNLKIPLLGTFSAHIVIDDGKYAGRKYGKVGGHMYGKILRIKSSRTSHFQSMKSHHSGGPVGPEFFKLSPRKTIKARINICPACDS